MDPYPLCVVARQRLEEERMRQRIDMQQEKNFWTSHFLWVRVVSKESRRLVLPGTSCYISLIQDNLGRER
jgi:hypothetical protein